MPWVSGFHSDEEAGAWTPNGLLKRWQNNEISAQEMAQFEQVDKLRLVLYAASTKHQEVSVVSLVCLLFYQLFPTLPFLFSSCTGC